MYFLAKSTMTNINAGKYMKLAELIAKN